MWIILVFYLSPLDYDGFNIIDSKKGYECKWTWETIQHFT